MWCPLSRAFLCALRPPTPPTSAAGVLRSLIPPRGRGLWGARGGAGTPCVVPRSRPALSPYARPRSSGESGVRSLRPRAFLCGVGGYSPPSAALKCCGRRSPTREGKRLGRKHGRLFSTSGHICPRGWGAASAGGRPLPAPGCPPRPSLCGGLWKCPAAGFCGGWRLIRLPPAADICAVRGSCAPSALCLRGC